MEEIRVIGTPEDVARWAEKLREIADVRSQSPQKPARKNGHVLVYFTGSLK